MDFISQCIKRYPNLVICEKTIAQACDLIISSYKAGGKLLIAGNGGSAADSDHISGELLKSFIKKRRPEQAFLDRLIDSALMTASLNDVDGNVMFAQQVNGLGQPNDIFLGISTSGNSKNIIYAVVTAKAKGLKTIALTGRDGGKLRSIADVSIIVPETETYKIQELHLPVYHALCLQIEDYFFAE